MPISIDIKRIQDIADKYKLTDKEMQRTLDSALNRGRAVLYRNGIRLLGRNQDALPRSRVKFRVYSKFEKVDSTLTLWMGLRPLAQTRLNADEYREMRRLMTEQGLSAKDARYEVRRPIDIASVEAQLPALIQQAQDLVVADFERRAKAILARV